MDPEVATSGCEEISVAVQHSYNMYREYQCITEDTDEGASRKCRGETGRWTTMDGTYRSSKPCVTSCYGSQSDSQEGKQLRTVTDTVNIQVQKISTSADMGGHRRTPCARSSKPVIFISVLRQQVCQRRRPRHAMNGDNMDTRQRAVNCSTDGQLQTAFRDFDSSQSPPLAPRRLRSWTSPATD
jgi:hypothetical protein